MGLPAEWRHLPGDRNQTKGIAFRDGQIFLPSGRLALAGNVPGAIGIAGRKQLQRQLRFGDGA